MAACCICSGNFCNQAKFEKQKKCTAYSSTMHVAYQSENALQRELGVRVTITEQNAEALQGSLLQNIYRIPTQIQETTLPVPVFATEDGCLLYLFRKLLQSGRV
jgi:prolipoprotein diacylglyceryltransferase